MSTVRLTVNGKAVSAEVEDRTLWSTSCAAESNRHPCRLRYQPMWRLRRSISTGGR